MAAHFSLSISGIQILRNDRRFRLNLSGIQFILSIDPVHVVIDRFRSFIASTASCTRCTRSCCSICISSFPFFPMPRLPICVTARYATVRAEPQPRDAVRPSLRDGQRRWIITYIFHFQKGEPPPSLVCLAASSYFFQ